MSGLPVRTILLNVRSRAINPPFSIRKLVKQDDLLIVLIHPKRRAEGLYGRLLGQASEGKVLAPIMADAGERPVLRQVPIFLDDIKAVDDLGSIVAANRKTEREIPILT